MLALKFRTRDTSCLVNFQALKWARLWGGAVSASQHHGNSDQIKSLERCHQYLWNLTSKVRLGGVGLQRSQKIKDFRHQVLCPKVFITYYWV